MAKIVISIIVAEIIVALIAWAVADSTAPGPTPEPERRVEVKDLVINTPETGDAILMTVMDDEEAVCQYEGELEIWKGADGKCYAIIHVDQGSAEQTKGERRWSD